MIMRKGPRNMGEMRSERIAVAIPRFQAHGFRLLNPNAESSHTRTKMSGPKMKGLTRKSENRKRAKLATIPSAALIISHQIMNESLSGIAAFKAGRRSGLKPLSRP